MKSLLSLATLIPFTLGEVLPNSCRELEDGDHWIKLLDGDEYPAVQVRCSSGYTVLDYSKDNNIQEYFNTWTWWHQSAAGPTNDVHINWLEWYLPDDGNTKYAISPDCYQCEAEHDRQLYDESTTYWMTGTLWGCFWAIKGAHNCDVDWDTDTCYTCLGSSMQDQGNDRTAVGDDTTKSEYSSTGICPYNVQQADHYVPLTHDDCTHEESSAGKNGNGDISKLHLKPSIGTSGQYCVCTQPSATQYFEVEDNEMPSEPYIIEEEDHSDYLYVSLTNDDFKDGTYRIRNPGTYTIMEDITFDFNPNVESPNAQDAYLPLESQADDYPGADDYRNAFFLGFFAGITIEADNVVLDLNGHTLQMSDFFYYQQRWFTTIECSTQYFLPGQGIGNFGAQPKVASNTIIKNGVLGLTSHHGIHGNYNKDILIQDVIVKEFETHGIQFNGFDGITLKNVEVGPTSSKVFFNGEYGHMRLLVPRYRKIAEESEGETIQFYGRDEAVTMADITEEIEKQMDYAFDYVVNGVTVDEDNEDYDSYQSAIKLFVNEKGVPNGGAQFGIFLNTFGASVFTYNLYTGFYSTDATLENVKIHGMRHDMDEYVRLHKYATGDIIINPFNGPLDLEEMFESVDDFSDPKYKGNIMTDAYMASNYFSDNFGYLQLQLIENDEMVAWAQGGDFYETTGNSDIQIGCNSDVMIHSGKGINGLRLDGVDGVTVKNLEIYDIYDSSTTGKETCGEYEDFCALCGTTGGHFRQTKPMQVGFTGNMAQAINVNAAKNVEFENIYIHDISSATGPAFGISIWPACDVTLKGDINVENLEAGKSLDKGTYSYDDRPNKAPETCGIRAHYKYSSYSTTVDDSDASISVKCVGGHIGCHGSSTMRTQIGEYSNDECEVEDFDSSFQSVDSDNTYDKMAKSKLAEKTSESQANTNSVSYIPEQSLTNVSIELILLCFIIFAGYQLYNRKQNSKSYSLLQPELAQEYGTENAAF